MRIVTAREQVQLLAAWRRTAGWADWNVTARYPSYGPDAATHEANLENGHKMMVSSGQWGGSGPSHMFWDYHIADHDGQTLAYRGFPATDNYPPETGSHPPRMRTADEAKSAAEEHYQRLFPIGSDTGKHDSGIDYSDLSKFMGEL